MSQAHSEWCEPEPIQQTLLPVIGLPKGNIPDAYRDWVCDIAHRMQCPVDYIAVALIVVTASIIGAGCGIKPKQKDDWLVIPNLWGGIVGRPGKMKTPAVSEVMQPLGKLEADAKQAFDLSMATYQAELEDYKAEKEALKSAMLNTKKQALQNKLVKLDSLALKNRLLQLLEPKKPIWKRYKTNDATIEKLSELLADNLRGLLIYRDELIGLLSTWDQEGREGDRAFFLEAWNGYGSLTTDRIGRGTVHTENLCLSIFGNTQPAKLIQYLHHAMRGMDNDGLLQRFQLLIYPDDLPAWKLIDREPNELAKEQVFNILQNLSTMDFTKYGAIKEAKDRFPYFRFDDDAQDLFFHWLKELEQTILESDDQPIVIEHLSKYRSLVPSLALVFHLIEVANGATNTQINYDTTLKANLIQDNSHKATMKSLQEGKRPEARKEISAKKLESALKSINELEFDSTVLGVSKYTGNYAVVPDGYVNQNVLVLGTTGGGKTITLRRFYHRAITKGYPLVVIDGKPSDDNVIWLKKMAEKHNRPFYGFNCDTHCHYDCLASGGYTELKDKIISLKDQWESDYYRSIAEDYLQTSLQVLLKSKKSFDLKKIVDCLNYDNLLNLSHELNEVVLAKKIAELGSYDRKDILGLQAHLNILINSELGSYFVRDHNTFTLSQVIDEGAVLYFALPALRFPSFSKVLGKLVINDLKAVIDHYNHHDQRVFMVFDEFSVFAGDQVLNLVNMGRGKGVHAIFGTQGLGDLDKVDETFKDQVLNCVNTIICHRLNDQKSAEGIANWIGTEYGVKVTVQIGEPPVDSAKGSARWSKEFIVHPDDIKQGLQAGEAFYITKVGKFWQDKVRVKFS